MKFEDQVLLIADGSPDSQGDFYFSKNVKLTNPEVPVLLEFNNNRRVGTATLSIHDDKVYTSFTVEDPATQEILKAGKTLTPCMGMVISARGTEPFDPEKHTYTPFAVGLSSRGNTDPRIPSLKNS